MNPTRSPSPSSPVREPISPAEINASCRVPLFVLFVGSAVALLVASVFGLIASIKFHSPDFLSDCAMLTYGRVHAAAATAFVYGFAVPAGLGVSLWILAQLGGNRVAQPWGIAFGGHLWNLGVVVGIVAILLGDNTGFEGFEMPRYAGVILFLGFLITGVGVGRTLLEGRNRGDHPSQWFLVAGLFWFPWIFSTALLTLTGTPVRGMMQALIAWWYSGNLNLVWTGLVGLGAIFYFLPRLTGKPLHSKYLALFAFWTVILFASWTGIPSSAPLPAWIPSLSAVATILTVVPVLAVAVNVYATGCPVENTKGNTPGRFMALGAIGFLLSWLMNVAGALPGISPIVNFTWFRVAQSHLGLYGFFALTMFGAIYQIVPQITGLEWPFGKLVRAHLWLAGLGIVQLVAPLAVGGVLQGLKLIHPSPTMIFADLAKTTILFLRISSTGEVLMLIGYVFFLANLTALTVRYYQIHFVPAYESATALQPAEAKA